MKDGARFCFGRGVEMAEASTFFVIPNECSYYLSDNKYEESCLYNEARVIRISHPIRVRNDRGIRVRNDRENMVGNEGGSKVIE